MEVPRSRWLWWREGGCVSSPCDISKENVRSQTWRLHTVHQWEDEPLRLITCFSVRSTGGTTCRKAAVSAKRQGDRCELEESWSFSLTQCTGIIPAGPLLWLRNSRSRAVKQKGEGGKKISVGINAELQRLLQQCGKDLDRGNHGGKPTAGSEEERAKAGDMRQQCERPWKLVSAWTWPLCQQDCVRGEAPASVLLWGWGWEPEPGGEGITAKAESLLRLGEPYNDFPYVNAKLG